MRQTSEKASQKELKYKWNSSVLKLVWKGVGIVSCGHSTMYNSYFYESQLQALSACTNATWLNCLLILISYKISEIGS